MLTTQKETDYQTWIDASKEAFRVLEKPIKTCLLKRETAIKGVPHSVYVVQTGNDSLNVFLDKMSNKVTRFDGQNDILYTAYSAYFDMPFEVREPKIPYEKDKDLGVYPFARTNTDFEDYNGQDSVFMIVETNPEFEGGEKEFFRFLRENWHFPRASLEEGLRGTVYIGFVVEKDGRLTNFKVKRGVNAECDAESLRVAKLMSGKWKAGMMKGKKVRVAYTQQFKFRAGCG